MPTMPPPAPAVQSVSERTGAAETKEGCIPRKTQLKPASWMRFEPQQVHDAGVAQG